MRTILTLTLLILVALCVPALAQFNGSFEQYTGDPAGWGAQAVGWTGYWGSFDWNVVAAGGPWHAPAPIDGNVLAICKAGGPYWPVTAYSPTIPAGVYSVSFWANRFAAYDSGYPMKLDAGREGMTEEFTPAPGWKLYSLAVNSSSPWKFALGLRASNDDLLAVDGITLALVPEPSAVCGLGVGLMGLLAARYRRRG